MRLTAIEEKHNFPPRFLRSVFQQKLLDKRFILNEKLDPQFRGSAVWLKCKTFSRQYHFKIALQHHTHRTRIGGSCDLGVWPPSRLPLMLLIKLFFYSQSLSLLSLLAKTLRAPCEGFWPSTRYWVLHWACWGLERAGDDEYWKVTWELAFSSATISVIAVTWHGLIKNRHQFTTLRLTSRATPYACFRFVAKKKGKCACCPHTEQNKGRATSCECVFNLPCTFHKAFYLFAEVFQVKPLFPSLPNGIASPSCKWSNFWTTGSLLTSLGALWVPTPQLQTFQCWFRVLLKNL